MLIVREKGAGCIDGLFRSQRLMHAVVKNDEKLLAF